MAISKTLMHVLLGLPETLDATALVVQEPPAPYVPRLPKTSYKPEPAAKSRKNRRPLRRRGRGNRK